MGGLIGWAGVFAISALHVPTVATEAPQRASFQVGAQAISWRIPKGYCLPATGVEAAVFQAIAAADDQNVTDLSLAACANGKVNQDRYVLVKTPKAVLLPTFQRAEFLASLRKEFGVLGTAEAISKSASEDASKKFTELLGSKTSIQATAKPISVDALCGYIGGTGNYAVAAGTWRVAFGACMTIVKGKVVTVYVYDRFVDVSTISQLVSDSRVLAEDLIAQNENVIP